MWRHKAEQNYSANKSGRNIHEVQGMGLKWYGHVMRREIFR